jgi:DNA-binding PadR family transcriptional regulator
MTEEALMGTGELDYTCRGPSNERTSPTIPLRRSLCLITPSLLDAALLQQLVYLTNKRGEDEWVRVDAEYLGSPFDVATQTIRDHLGRLERAGFVSSRRPRTNGAKEYRIEHDVVLEAIRREAPDATEDDATSPPLETRRGGARDTKVKGARSSNGGPRDTGAQQKDYNQTRKKEYNEEAVESERTRSKSNEHSRKSSSTTTEPPTQPPETGRTLTELEQFVLEKLAPWSADIGDVRDVIETLQVFNLGDRDIRQYVSERRVDFSNRKRELSRGEVLRYLASRQDLIDYGYTQPIEPVQKRRRQKERQEDADGRRDSWETDAPSQEEPPSDEEDDSTWKPRTAPREQPDEMDDFFEQCREQLRGEVVDEYVEGVLFFDGIEERIVEFETEAPFRCLEVHEKYRNEIEAAAREVWTDVEGVRLLLEGGAIGG